MGRWSSFVEKEGKEVALQTVTVSETDTDRNQVTLASAFFCLFSNPVLQMQLLRPKVQRFPAKVDAGRYVHHFMVDIPAWGIHQYD